MVQKGGKKMPEEDKELLNEEDEELLDEDEDEEDFGTQLEDWEDPYEDARYEEWKESMMEDE